MIKPGESALLLNQEVCVDVAIPLPIEGPFSYLLTPDQISKAQVGVRVRVPFKNREMTGFLVNIRESVPDQPLKKIISILDDRPVISERTLRLTAWLGAHYFSSWGEAIETAVPKWIKQGRKAKAKSEGSQLEDPLPTPEWKLTEEQEKALTLIQTSLKEKQPNPILLYGVTGSGKTELYIRAVKEVLSRNKGAIVLVPEIALTEQIRRFFFHHFGKDLEIIHSKLSEGERCLAWKRIESGEKKVLLGPRSALFAPMPHLGLILMDEEQEGSYKQDSSPRYHAREVALWLAREENALFIMGTATPSLEAMCLAEKGIFQRIDLTRRVENKKLPEITIVDLKKEGDIQKRNAILSRLLAREIETNLRQREGTLLLLNRRGFSTQIHCTSCGEVVDCPSCEVSLTFHQEDQKLICHYCNFQIPVPQHCRKCSKPLLRYTGFGTEKVESEIGRVFPQARVARIDTDSIRRKGSHEKILQEFRSRKIDILVGTQMIAKGFDFPHVTLVGVVLADVGLVLPDFRSSERTFQLLTQVAGRAGRGDRPGRVIIQTYSPEHPSVVYAKNHDYWHFYQQEIEKRTLHHYPPIASMINILIRSKIEKRAYLFAREFREALKEKVEIKRLEIIGPAPLPFYRLRGHYRWHLLIKSQELADAQILIRKTLTGFKRRSGVAMQIDVHPINIL